LIPMDKPRAREENTV